MKKIALLAIAACAALALTTACSDDYAEASAPHIYGETENPPIKGSDADMASTSIRMKQPEAGREVKTVPLAPYDSLVQQQLGMSLDEAFAAIDKGTVRFLPINPARRVWDKTQANAGDNKWLLTPAGTIAASEKEAAATVELLPASRELKIQLTKNAAAGIIPVTVGLVKTSDTAYPVNFRCQTLVTVTDSSFCDVEVTVPKGGYASAPFKFADIAPNVKFALGITDLKQLAKGLDVESPVYDVYMMNGSGTLYGGPGKYTSNGAGYWLNQKLDIVKWNTDGFALFIEPFIYDDEAKDFYADGGGFSIGRLSNDTPASGTVINATVVIKPTKSDKPKALTINMALKFE